MNVELRKVILLLFVLVHLTSHVGGSTTEFPFDSILRTVNGTGSLPIDQETIEALIKYAENVDPMQLAQTQYNRLHVLERNLVKGGHHLQKGTSSYNAMLYAKADANAFALSKEAYKKYRASLYVVGKECAKFVLPASCVESLKQTTIQKTHIMCAHNNYRTINGTCNNGHNPSWGSAYRPYSRLISPAYSDGVWDTDVHRKDLPNAATVGEKLEDNTIIDETKYSMGFVGWTNLVAYDLAHTVSFRMLHYDTDIVCCGNDFKIISPRYEHPFCLPLIQGQLKCYNYVRSMLSTPNDKLFSPAQQMNAATHYLDGSSIYGTTDSIAKRVRLKKRGQLKIFMNNCEEGKKCLNLADSRPNMDLVSATTHTILMLEHNRVAKALHALNPSWNDEILYQEARRIVIAQLQHITYNEWLPILIGENLKTRNYDPTVDSSVYNSFANAAMQFVLSLFPDDLNVYYGNRSVAHKIPMKFAMVDHKLLKDRNNFNKLVGMLLNQPMPALDLNFTEAITKNFFSEGDVDGFNGVSLAVQRSRDHGLPVYVEFKHNMIKNAPVDDFSHLKSDIPVETLELLQYIYKKPEYIDLFVGGMAESPRKRALIGPTFSEIIKRQMVITKIGDQFFYDNPYQKYPFTSAQLKEIKKSSFARLLCDNSEDIKEMQPIAFETLHSHNKLVSCSDETEIPSLNLGFWKK